MTLKAKIARRIAAGLGAAVVLVGLATSPASAAMQIDSYDCFPAGQPQVPAGQWYCANYPGTYSTDGGNATARGEIDWTNNNGYAGNIGIHVVVADHGGADGKGSIAQVRWSPGTGAADQTNTYHNTTGGSVTYTDPNAFTASAGRVLNDNDEISVRVCNGTSGGSPINCGAWHGPFHRY